jgi:hypothetical protein
MVLQQAVFLGGMGTIFTFANYDDDVLIVSMLIAAAYWYAMGTLLSTELGQLSHRVRRQLPQSRLGQMMLGWFNPGPNTGYYFAIANLTSVAVMVGIGLACLYYLPLTTRTTQYADVLLGSVAALSYVTIYLGLGKMLTAGVRRLAPVTGAAGFLIHILVVLACSGIPFAIQMSMRSLRNAGYTMLQWPNPFWSIVEIVDGRNNTEDSFVQVTVLAGLAACLLLISLPAAARELLQDRVALPERVMLDETELHAEPIKPQNPWEADEMTTNDVT